MKKCENCDIFIVEKYASGRFCKESCARSFSTKKNRKAINEKVKKTAALKRESDPTFIHEIKSCLFCGIDFYVKGKIGRLPKFCTRRCSSSFHNKNEDTKNKIREARIKSIEAGNVGYGLKASYNGIRCDSALEYAFLKQWFEKHPDSRVQRFLGSIRDEGITYIPDFLIDDKLIVEVKYSTPYVGNCLSEKWKTYVKTIEAKKRILIKLKQNNEYDFIWVTEKDIGISFYRKCIKECKDIRLTVGAIPRSPTRL